MSELVLPFLLVHSPSGDLVKSTILIMKEMFSILGGATMELIIALALITVIVVMDYYCREEKESKTIAIKKNVTMF